MSRRIDTCLLPTFLQLKFSLPSILTTTSVMATTMAAEVVPEETAKGPSTVVVVGIDESEHSQHALEWTLDHLFSSSTYAANFKLVVIYAKPSAAAIIIDLGMAGAMLFYDCVGSSDLIESVESDLKKIANLVIEKARDLCISKSVGGVHLEVVEGDARNVLCKAVEKHHGDLLVLGSHGYGAFKRSSLVHLLISNKALLGSVSDHCVHYAPCNVMIVKKSMTHK